MSIVAVFLLSAIAIAFSGLFIVSPVTSEKLHNMRLSIPMVVYRAPERKAVLVDAQHAVQRTADNTQLTLRDRGERVEFYHAPQVSYISVQGLPPQEVAPTQTTPDQTAPLQTAPDLVVAANSPEFYSEAPSLDLKVKAAIDTDTGITALSKSNFHATTRNGKVVLEGEVFDEAEKTWIQNRAEAIAGAGNVDNQLTIVKV